MDRQSTPEKTDKSLSIPGNLLAELIDAVHQRGASFRFRATGISMIPAIHNQDILTVSPVKEMAPFAGEVIAFRHPDSNKLILHRVVKKRGEKYIIRADSLREIDAVIGPTDIIGVVTRVERTNKVIVWPDRFQHPITCKIYFRINLVVLRMRRTIKIPYHFCRRRLSKMGKKRRSKG
jgi:hypothetical protein